MTPVLAFSTSFAFCIIFFGGEKRQAVRSAVTVKIFNATTYPIYAYLWSLALVSSAMVVRTLSVLPMSILYVHITHVIRTHHVQPHAKYSVVYVYGVPVLYA